MLAFQRNHREPVQNVDTIILRFIVNLASGIINVETKVSATHKQDQMPVRL